MGCRGNRDAGVGIGVLGCGVLGCRMPGRAVSGSVRLGTVLGCSDVWGWRLPGVLGSGGALSDSGGKVLRVVGWERCGSWDRVGGMWGTAPCGESSPTAVGLVPFLGRSVAQRAPSPFILPEEWVLRAGLAEAGTRTPKCIRVRDAGPVACAWSGRECGELLGAPACLISSGCLPTPSCWLRALILSRMKTEAGRLCTAVIWGSGVSLCPIPAGAGDAARGRGCASPPLPAGGSRGGRWGKGG